MMLMLGKLQSLPQGGPRAFNVDYASVKATMAEDKYPPVSRGPRAFYAGNASKKAMMEEWKLQRGPILSYKEDLEKICMVRRTNIICCGLHIG